MQLFIKKNTLSYEMNIYKLLKFNFNQNKEVIEILKRPIFSQSDFIKLKQIVYTTFFPISSIYALTLNKLRTIKSLEQENIINVFNEVVNEPNNAIKTKEWLYQMYERGKVEIPQVPQVQDQGLFRNPFSNFWDKLNLNGFNKFMENINNFSEFVSKLFGDIKWIFQNPIQSILIVDKFVFEYAAIALLILFIVALFTQMFTGEKELRKPIKYLKSLTLITFIASIVLECFLATGFK